MQTLESNEEPAETERDRLLKKGTWVKSYLCMDFHLKGTPQSSRCRTDGAQAGSVSFYQAEEFRV